MVDRGLKTRLVIGCIALVAALSALSGRLLQIEAFHSESLSKAARSHYEDKEPLSARRGRIYDRTGELLARSQTVYTLYADPRHLSDLMIACIGLGKRDQVSPQTIKARFLPEEILGNYREYIADCLAEKLQRPKHEIARALRQPGGADIVLARKVEDDFARDLNKVIDEHELGGVYLREGERRYYPSPLTLTQVIGYVDEKNDGIAGVEKAFDEALKGTPGYRYCERDRERREIHAYRGLQVDPVPGKDVYLTIDMALQTVVERELDAVIDRFRPAKVTAIFMDPTNGEILAMASRPHFDLATREGIRDIAPVRHNPAVSDLYQPGSTFKVVGFGAIFDRGLADPSTEVDCHLGLYDAGGFNITDHHPYGKLTARMAFAKSSNIGTYLLTRPLNREYLGDYIHRFGFGQKTGIELNGEHAGTILDEKRWSATSFYSQVIGYEISVTPLQMAMACAVVANDGVYQAPTILRGIREDRMGAKLEKKTAPSGRRVIGEKAANQLQQCMIETMGPYGTGTKGDLAGYSVAGKTGTARKHVEKVGYVKGLYTASFMGFLPAENPRLLGLIVVDEPKADGPMVYGGAVAAPVFHNVVAEAVKILGIEPDQPEELLQDPPVPLASAPAAKEAKDGKGAR